MLQNERAKAACAEPVRSALVTSGLTVPPPEFVIGCHRGPEAGSVRAQM